MGRPAKNNNSKKEEVVIEKKEKKNLNESNERFQVEPIKGLNGWTSVKDVKYNIVYEFENDRLNDTLKIRPLEGHSMCILNQSKEDFFKFIG